MTLRSSDLQSDGDLDSIRKRDSDLDLNWGQFSDLVTQLTITNKLRKLNHDIEG